MLSCFFFFLLLFYWVNEDKEFVAILSQIHSHRLLAAEAAAVGVATVINISRHGTEVGVVSGT